jgi:RimJ/RimL family protein N-acetyltransferase
VGRAAVAFTVRCSTPDDVDDYIALRIAVAAEGRGIGAELPLNEERDRQVFLASIVADTEQSLVAVDADGVVIGSLGIQLFGYGVAGLGMMVADGWRGRGVGSALLQAGIDWARSAGAHKVELQHWPTNTAAAALYEKFGFMEEGRLRRHYRRRSGELWDAVVRGLVLDEDTPGGP